MYTNAAAPRSPSSFLTDAVLRIGTVIGSGVASAGVIGYWLGASVQCSVKSAPTENVPCPLASETFVLYLGLLTVAVVLLSAAVVLGTLPRLGSIASATLVAGSFLFPLELVFPNLADISGMPAPLLLAAMVVCGGSVGFFEPIRWRDLLHRDLEPSNTIAFGSALVAFTGWAAYWLPQNLSGSSICAGPLGGSGYCLAPSAPLIPEVFSVGLIALGIGIAAPIVSRQFTETGLCCGVGVLCAALLAGLANSDLLLFAMSIGFGSFVALTGLIARLWHVHLLRNHRGTWPPNSSRRSET